uniref:Nucleotide/sugar transporter family protein n=2 Tax=Zea mays TaxID=4577 RepID=A0A804PAT8_MAIZE
MASSAPAGGKSPAVGGEEMSEGAGSRTGVAGALGLSVTSSVAIVICNKYLISTLGFFFAMTLTSWHLMVTFFTLYVAQRLRLFEPKPIDARTVISFGLLNGIYLGFNSVGFYQTCIR